MAVSHGWAFDALVYDVTRPLSSWAAGVLDARPEATRYEMSPDLVAALSGKDEPSELIALVRMRDRTLADIAPRPDLLVVVVDRPSSPGNLGTIVRSSDALGAAAVVTTGHGADVYEPAAVTASRGSLFAVPVVHAESSGEVLALARRVREAVGTCQVVGADERGTRAISDVDLTKPTILVAGNETHGLSRAYREGCDVLARIPMSGAATSLNVAVATSILLYETARQRSILAGGRS
jgi:TrmH family RNA methyltransferase